MNSLTVSIVVAASIDISLVPVGAAFDPGSRAQAFAFGTLANGLAVDLSSGASQPLATAAPASTIAGTRVRIEAIVDVLPWAMEGTYGDVLTFVVTAK
jgi:hypothetical protein